jgi:hypothetical protein
MPGGMILRSTSRCYGIRKHVLTVGAVHPNDRKFRTLFAGKQRRGGTGQVPRLRLPNTVPRSAAQAIGFSGLASTLQSLLITLVSGSGRPCDSGRDHPDKYRRAARCDARRPSAGVAPPCVERIRAERKRDRAKRLLTDASLGCTPIVGLPGW